MNKKFVVYTDPKYRYIIPRKGLSCRCAFSQVVPAFGTVRTRHFSPECWLSYRIFYARFILLGHKGKSTLDSGYIWGPLNPFKT